MIYRLEKALLHESTWSGNWSLQVTFATLPVLCMCVYTHRHARTHTCINVDPKCPINQDNFVVNKKYFKWNNLMNKLNIAVQTNKLSLEMEVRSIAWTTYFQLKFPRLLNYDMGWYPTIASMNRRGEKLNMVLYCGSFPSCISNFYRSPGPLKKDLAMTLASVEVDVCNGWWWGNAVNIPALQKSLGKVSWDLSFLGLWDFGKGTWIRTCLPLHRAEHWSQCRVRGSLNSCWRDRRP